MTGVEWWDVLDEAGKPTGEAFRRGTPGWPAGRFHLIVATCVVRADGSVLLTRRAVTKSEFPLAWEFPGGSALAGESSRRAAQRELREETGVEVAEDELELVGRFREQSALLDMYVVAVQGVPVVTVDEAEVDDAAWVTWDDVGARLGAGRMAEPWVDRLHALGPGLRSAAVPR
ncbi:NUDIX hydrolase [Isoptericola sediminis]|uniref:NUDIX hydrolase n=1 Tax=Isoptericola sediminis TaxID=2733572 RepID=A0A849K521_9MICO|nr:NUDIX hydrolase [Isoptericola sediminis]NNU27139.1 NUDIX hydrolase [Isoptericola sediminis]